MTAKAPNSVSFQDSLKRIAVSLLDRALTSEDGIAPADIVLAEHRLCRPVPQQLKDFYRLVGRLPLFMNSFQRFMLPDQLYEDDGLLVFAEENQAVCRWGVDASGEVFQIQDTDRYDIELNLAQFLELMIYYQVALGAEFTYLVDIGLPMLLELLRKASWKAVVDHDGLCIFNLMSFLIWYFRSEGTPSEDQIFFSSNSEVPLDVKISFRLKPL